MSDESVLESVAEHHTDMLLVEELKCDPEFASWFAQRCGVDPAPVSFVRNSVWETAREDDVRVQFGGPSGSTVLVENKVTAALSLNQAEDYGQRRDGLLVRGETAVCRTCIMAPAAWIAAHPEHGFDVAISYEEIADAIARVDQPRTNWRASVFRQGANRAKRKLTHSNDEVSKFLGTYYKFAELRFPDLETARSTGYKSLIVVYPLNLGSKLQLSRYVDVQHNLPEQRMKVTITDCRAADAEAVLGLLTSQRGWLITQNGQRTDIAAQVPEIVVGQALSTQELALAEVFSQAREMVQFVKVNAEMIRSIPRASMIDA